MNAEVLLDVLGEVDSAYIWDAQKMRDKASVRKPAVKRMWLIAALVAAGILMLGCAVVYALNLKDLAVGEKHQEYYDGSSQQVTVLTLQGMAGTPGYQAAQEWFAFREGYSGEGCEDYGEEYAAYIIYTPEMKEKLDEICQTYDLKLLGKMYVDPDVEAGFEALGIHGILRPGVEVTDEWDSLVYYASGCFRFEDYVTLEGQQKRIVSFVCQRKDVFTELYPTVGPEGTYEEWTYTTSYGVDVLMVIDNGGVRGHAFIMADRGEYMYYLSIYEFDGMLLPDKAGLEAYAEAFDFTVEPQPVSADDLQAAEDREQNQAENHDYYAMFRFNMETKMWSPPEEYAGSIDSYVGYIREHAPAEYQYYTLMDLNSDGEEELLWGTQDGHLYEVVSMKDGLVILRFYDYLCQGNVLLWERDHAIYNGLGMEVYECKTYEYWTLEERIVQLYYLPETDQWIECRPGCEDQIITYEQAQQIMAQYPKVELEMHPFSEYPNG